MGIRITAGGRALLALVVALPVVFPVSPAGAAASPTTIPRADCRPGDPVETGLQGQVPREDRASGRAATGYACNLKLVGAHRSYGFGNFDTYKECAYYSDNQGGVGTIGQAGTVVLDVSDPRHPVRTDYLTARAMRNAGESLRVNARRGLLVADHYGNGHGDSRGNGSAYPWLAVYDVSADCRHPRLLADAEMPNGRGHEGWFSPDGMTYYMANPTGGPVVPVDLTDPANPRELATWRLAVHGGSISEDGSRAYLALVSPAALLVVDTSDVGPGRPNRGRVISTLPLPDTGFNQSTNPLDYDGHPYVVDFGEMAVAAHSPCSVPRNTNFDYARMIDIADEEKPRIVSRFMNEVDDPANCERVIADRQIVTRRLDRGDPTWVIVSGLFAYDSHYCTPDRLHNPTILACAQFMSGLRVYDIRDPRRPREIAYYNPGTLSANDPTVDIALARPVIRRDLGQIWFVTFLGGFHAVEFEDSLWPFPGDDPCPGGHDYFQSQYDPNYEACRATRRKG
jgi:hypothetical protein